MQVSLKKNMWPTTHTSAAVPQKTEASQACRCLSRKTCGLQLTRLQRFPKRQKHHRHAGVSQEKHVAYNSHVCSGSPKDRSITGMQVSLKKNMWPTTHTSAAVPQK